MKKIRVIIQELDSHGSLLKQHIGKSLSVRVVDDIKSAACQSFGTAFLDLPQPKITPPAGHD